MTRKSDSTGAKTTLSQEPAPEAKGRSQTRDTSAAPSSASAESCACRQKATPRSAELQQDVQKRLNRVIGQLNGVKTMVEDNRYCGDVLTQLAAAESAIHRVSDLLMREHLKTCVTEQIREGNDEVIDEVMDLLHRFAK